MACFVKITFTTISLHDEVVIVWVLVCYLVALVLNAYTKLRAKLFQSPVEHFQIW